MSLILGYSLLILALFYYCYLTNNVLLYVCVYLCLIGSYIYNLYYETQDELAFDSIV